MPSFIGFVSLGSTLVGTILTRDGNSPKNPTAGPTYRCYGENSLMTNGTGTATKKDTGNITGATNASPIVITSSGHGLTTGTRVTVASVGGNTAANGDFTITEVSSSTFSLDSSTGNGAYTSGGTWNVAGLYTFSLDVSAANGFETGKTYSVLWTATVSGTVVSDILTFTVV